MKLRFTGIGSAFNTAMGNTSAFFTRGEDLYLVDCGEQVFAKLMRAGIFERYPGKITVLLTHTHADHAGSLATLCLYAAEVLGRPALIIHPDDGVRALLAHMGVGPDKYTLSGDLYGQGLSATPFPARHVPAIPAFSYLLEDEEGLIYYSGDSGDLPPDILDRVRGGEIRHAYVDTNIFDTLPEKPIHLPLQTLASLVEPPLRDRFTLMHLNRDFRGEAEREGFACATADAVFD